MPGWDCGISMKANYCLSSFDKDSAILETPACFWLANANVSFVFLWAS